MVFRDFFVDSASLGTLDSFMLLPNCVGVISNPIPHLLWESATDKSQRASETRWVCFTTKRELWYQWNLLALSQKSEYFQWSLRQEMKTKRRKVPPNRKYPCQLIVLADVGNVLINKKCYIREKSVLADRKSVLFGTKSALADRKCSVRSPAAALPVPAAKSPSNSSESAEKSSQDPQLSIVGRLCDLQIVLPDCAMFCPTCKMFRPTLLINLPFQLTMDPIAKLQDAAQTKQKQKNIYRNLVITVFLLS